MAKIDRTERCVHIDPENPEGRIRALCTAVHYTPEQAHAFVRAILADPRAKQAQRGYPVPEGLL